jgi:CRISPR-associated endonuclease/helicase Cas3
LDEELAQGCAWAHSRNAHRRRHSLEDHLRGTARLAQEFCEPFGAGELGYWAGLWHDLGKFHPDWQTYLDRSERGLARRGGPDHKLAGALLALENLEPAALVVLGHHGGLPSASTARERLQPAEEDADHVRARAALELARTQLPDLLPDAPISRPGQVTDELSAEFFIRMLFSALVDADSLDTEAHHEPEASLLRAPPPLRQLAERFGTGRQRLLSGRRPGPLDGLRAEVFDQCVAAASQPPGCYRLAVPTGGGKTLSALGFALAHAAAHDLRRVVVAVPFTTVTQQVAGVYRQVLGDREGTGVLEHHSVVDFDRLPGSVPRWAKLAVENWDAPVVVTTTVQLFESLLGRRRSATRKLHRLAGSVIVLDEAQGLPVHLLEPILDVLRRLVAGYGSTVVLSTATQPAFEEVEPFAAADIRDLAPPRSTRSSGFARVAYEWHLDPAPTWEQVAGWLAAERQVLAVVNTKDDAVRLFEALGDEDALHLSTRLCQAHRAKVLGEIQQRLVEGLPCRVVATQVVEAGVDLDFPVVARALAPPEALIQAAGRCNRDGRGEQPGRVLVFRPADGRLPQGAYRIATHLGQAFFGPGRADPEDPEALRRYFGELYRALGRGGTDREGIQGRRRALDYPEVARRFRMIDEDTVPLVVHWGERPQREEADRALRQLTQGQGPMRDALRIIQPFTVTVRRHEAAQLGAWTEWPLPNVLGRWHGEYDQKLGLKHTSPPEEHQEYVL